ncbi:hypothetical protein NP493_228g05027 [Ridgeia piscesae]|uniref:Uncharacterized protein n=1 Tax=Ridgeia piscesae TaxID=27915 RepID=A0AAD9UDN7_RIDPI|nr:hypothetical protein NP493_228g05027 [Ridgeia piscesae]
MCCLIPLQIFVFSEQNSDSGWSQSQTTDMGHGRARALPKCHPCLLQGCPCTASLVRRHKQDKL